MTISAQICVFLWAVVFGLFAVLKREPVTIAIGMVAGWPFLPNFDVPLQGFPDLDKVIVVAVVSTVASLMAMPTSAFTFRPQLLDLPFVGLCFCGFLTSAMNDLGYYDGVSSAFSELCHWILPYLIGRVVFASGRSSRTLIVTMVLAGLLYSVLCIFEIRMSPRLHSIVYGMAPRSDQNYFTQARRFGMWRPTVFMEHGLALALLMGSLSTLAVWLAAEKVMSRIAGIPARAVAAFLGLITILCVSAGAVVLTAAGWITIFARRSLTGRLSLLTVAALTVLYPAARMVQVAHLGDTLTSVSETVVGDERAESFAFRIKNEERMLDRWRQQPILGLASRFSTTTADEKRIVTDSYWIVILTKFGLAGWVCWTTGLILPAILYARRMTSGFHSWRNPGWAFALLGVLFAADSLVNKMHNPLIVVCIGASISLLTSGEQSNSESSSGADAVRLSLAPERRLWPPSPSRKQTQVAGIN